MYATPRKPSRAAADVEAARERLRELAPEGSTIYTVLRGDPSRSGMSRSIALYVIRDGEPQWITWYAATALRDRWDDRREAIRVHGAGMDMGFHLVDSLAHAVHGSGTAYRHRWL